MTVSTPAVRFSAIVMAHGRTQFLEASVRSVLAQTLPRNQLEVLVTKDFAHAYVDSLPDIRVLDSSRTEVGVMMADALAETTGEVVAFLDDDDRWAADKLSTVRTAFVGDRQLVYLAHGFSAIDERDRPVRADRPTVRREALLAEPMRVDAATASPAEIARAYAANPGNSFIAMRRDALVSQEPYLRRITAATDPFLFWSAARAQGHMLFTAAPHGYLRVHSENYSRPPKASFATYRARYSRMQREQTRSFRIIRDMVEGDPRLEALVDRELERNALFRDVAEGTVPRAEMLRSFLAGANDRLPERVSKALYAVAPSLAQVANFLNGMARW